MEPRPEKRSREKVSAERRRERFGVIPADEAAIARVEATERREAARQAAEADKGH